MINDRLLNKQRSNIGKIKVRGYDLKSEFFEFLKKYLITCGVGFNFAIIVSVIYILIM